MKNSHVFSFGMAPIGWIELRNFDRQPLRYAGLASGSVRASQPPVFHERVHSAFRVYLP
jgi:hypothetical protein